MDNPNTSTNVWEAVSWAVDKAVGMSVTWTVWEGVVWDVDRIVDETMPGYPSEIVPHRNDLKHPSLQDFIHEVDEG